MSERVDIIIPVYGGLRHLEKLVPALEATLKPDLAKVWFINDCTPPEKGAGPIAEFLTLTEQRLPFVRFVSTPKNSGYAGTNNFGVALGNAEYVCLLNSDTEPAPGWLDNMVAVLDDLPQVGVVGAKLLFPLWSKDPDRPAGKVQHAGVAFNTARLPYHLFLGWPADHPKVNRRVHMKAVTGACILTRRALYEKIGGLNTLYGQGNFEDIEYCLEAGERGYETVYCPDALVYHWGSGSNNTDDAERNVLIFSSRWSHRIESDDWLFW